MGDSRKSPPLQPEPASLPEHHVQQALAPLAGKHCTVGLSGGIDSVVLLDAAARCAPAFGIQLAAVHVHHGLSQDADGWQQFCIALAAEYGIKCSAHRVALCRRGGESLEALARDARHAVFAQLDTDAVLLAHHLDDQCETFLLRLLRGAGVQGLGGMRATRPLNAGHALLVRHLLSVTRQDILSHAAARGLSHVSDTSNHDLRFRRNWLRLSVLPQLESVYPAYRRQIEQSCQHLQEASDLLEQIGCSDFAGDLGQRWLDLDHLCHLPQARQRNLLRWFLRQSGISLSAAELAQLMAQLLNARPDSQPSLCSGLWWIGRYRNRLCLWPATRPACPAYSGLLLDDTGPISLPGWDGSLHLARSIGKGIARHFLNGQTVSVRPRQGGERLRPSPHGSRRQVKHLLQEAGIAPLLRQRWPMLWINDQLLAIPGVAVAAEFQAAPDEEGLWPEWGGDFALQNGNLPLPVR